jgi:hypothetical protein
VGSKRISVGRVSRSYGMDVTYKVLEEDGVRKSSGALLLMFCH